MIKNNMSININTKMNNQKSNKLLTKCYLIIFLVLSLFIGAKSNGFFSQGNWSSDKKEITFMNQVSRVVNIRQKHTIYKNQPQSAQQSECKCEHGASCFQETNLCLCTDDYIGEFCEQKAANITGKKIQSSVDKQEFTYFYFEPQQQNYFYMEVQICVLKGVSNMFNWFYVDIESKNGSFSRTPAQSQSANFTSTSEKCGILYTPLWPYVMKQNGRMQKLIFGIKTVQQNSATNESGQQQLISIQCYGSVFLSQAFWQALIIAFVSIFMIMLIFSVTICIKQRVLNRNGANLRQNQDHNIDHFDKIMPSLKYSNFIQEQLEEVTKYSANKYSQMRDQKQVGVIQNESAEGSVNDKGQMDTKSNSSKERRKIAVKQHECAICLADIQPNQMIRMTICKHIFHQQCLDKWCVKHITCPICRSSLSKSQAQIKFNQKSNIRQPMIQNQHQ